MENSILRTLKNFSFVKRMKTNDCLKFILCEIMPRLKHIMADCTCDCDAIRFKEVNTGHYNI